ncbi:MAG TPA: alpha/beta hydrolase-fold protein [Blastococcus sp.]|nr:alpha/beta hydrolase-fold protein [Blastococcus sp.]
MRTRRAFLAAVGAAAVVGAGGLVVERDAVHRWYSDLTDPEPAASPPTRTAGPLRSGSFPSLACGRQVGWQLAYPPGARPGAALPVALVLHGRGGDEASAFGELHLDGYLADVVAGGAAPFALAAVDGGDHSYWHARRSGEDPQAMLLQEFLPRLAAMGLRTARVGVLGWSMGGYGALLLAETVGPARIAAVAADSPALWQRAADAAAGAFDDASDFAAHDVFAGRARLAGVPVRIACGTRDPFCPAVRAFLPGVPDLVGADLGDGAHTNTFWRRTAPAQLRFLAGALAR